MSFLVKICGLTRVTDTELAVRAGADLIGLNLWPGSRRFVAPELAAELAAAARAVRADVGVVGVFVDQPAAAIAAAQAELALDHVQLHGDESPALCDGFGARAIKAVAVAGPGDLDQLARYRCPLFLVDSASAGRGGSGGVADWTTAAVAARRHSILLAGGLTPENVGDAIRAVRPRGVDVASGVEASPGHKDAAKLARFIANARAAAAEERDHG